MVTIALGIVITGLEVLGKPVHFQILATTVLYPACHQLAAITAGTGEPAACLISILISQEVMVVS